MFELPQHRTVLAALEALDADTVTACALRFGGGTQLALEFGEYRLSKDIDFLCLALPDYRLLRERLHRSNYSALFNDRSRVGLPRELQLDRDAVRFPVVMDGVTLRFEIVVEARLSLDPPRKVAGLPVGCLSARDAYAEKLLANADRWADTATMQRDLVDLCAITAHRGVDDQAFDRAESAYPVREPLTRALQRFNDPATRTRCLDQLQVRDTALIARGEAILRRHLDSEARTR